MTRCPFCGFRLIDVPDQCPACSKSLDDLTERPFEGGAAEHFDGDESGGVPMSVIARFKNAAEAGYFAHELRRAEQIPATVNFDESFDAAGGYWTTRYELTVPDAMTKTAAATLQRLIHHTEPESAGDTDGYSENWQEDAELSSFADAPFERPADPQTMSNMHWGPIVLTLAAGSAAFWGIGKLKEMPGPLRPPVPAGLQPEQYWNQLSKKSATWTQRLENGRGIRELRFDPDRKQRIIREDADGDGIFESYFEMDVAD